MSVLEAENGQEALTLFDKQQPDLVFLDVDMPLLNGFEVCRAIRQTERGQSLPVLIATGANDSRSIDQGFEAGATQYKTKPINWALLSRDVKYMLRAAEAFAALKAQQVQLRTLAYYDPLTSLPNRRSFVDQLKKSLDETADHQRSLGLLMVDLDHFKRIHDPLGEALSDSLLKVVAARLEERLSVYAPRGPDPHEAINRSDLDDMTIDLMRPGGDEFNIIVMKPNGEFINANSDLDEDDYIKPGDEIFALDEPDTKSLQLFKDLTQVMYQIAVSAAVIIAL